MILDTNAISALADGNTALKTLLLREQVHQLPVIVLGEYRYGLKRSRERSARERWLDELEDIFEILEITSNTSRSFAQIRHELREAGTPIPENDLWIASLAREHRLAIATQDKHFDHVTDLHRLSW